MLRAVGILLAGLLAVVGCTSSTDVPAKSNGNAAANYNYGYGSGDVPEFNDRAPSNTETKEDLQELTFTGVDGRPTDLKQYLGKQNVVLVITRGLTSTLDPNAKGNAGAICLYCATQTSRIASNYDEFKKRDAEVVIVFPVVKAEHAPRVKDFDAKVKETSKTGLTAVPFPVVLDIELKAVDQLGIRRDLSKPSTFILDKEGKVRYAYVGASLGDRPSVKAMLSQLDEINAAP